MEQPKEPREEKLLKTIALSEEWVAFAESVMWKRFVEEIVNEKIIKPVKDEWWKSDLDKKNNDKFIRDTRRQRTEIKTAMRIIQEVEAFKVIRDRAIKELEKIKSAESKQGETSSSKTQQP